jgi:uncharacterized protein YbbC (DUF1343 family)
MRCHVRPPCLRAPSVWSVLAWLALASTVLANPPARSAPSRPGSPPAANAGSAPTAAATSSVMLGIDVLAAEGFAAVRGKRIGLLTHPAGVNRHGQSTITLLHQAPQVQLVALFAPEHGLYLTEVAGAKVADTVDRRTGLPVYSLHGHNSRKPSAAQLRGLDALVIDLQDIGVRSYTFNVVMRYALDACFEHGVEAIVLDRPNPLGGRKVDGPLLDAEWMSGVGAFRIPYVHGLTMGELARWAAATPGGLAVTEAQRRKGRLTVIPMRGWRREMRWPDTGLNFVPTSQHVRDFAAVVGYAMIGLGCEGNGFTHGIGTPYPFRSLAFNGRSAAQLQADLAAMRLPGLAFRPVTVKDAKGATTSRVYVEVVDWERWNPTELSFHLMRLACRYEPPNPYARLSGARARTFNIHVGSTAWWEALRRDGARVDVERWVRTWRTAAEAWHQQTRPHWLYR